MNGAAALDLLDRLVPVSDFSRGKAGVIFSRAEREPVFVVKRNKPRYVVMSLEEYRRMQEELEDERDYRLAMERLEANAGKPTVGWKEMLDSCGLTQKDIDNAPEPTIE